MVRAGAVIHNATKGRMTTMPTIARLWLAKLRFNSQAGSSETNLDARSGRARRRPRLLTEEDGGPLVEFAMILPMMVMVMTGIFYLGVGLAQYIQLTNATDIAARQISISRGVSSLAADPCSTGTTYFESAAPNLSTSDLTFTYIINGTSHTGTSCTSMALTSASQGETATVQVSYPVHLGIYGAGWSTVTLKAQTSEIIQ
jgi:Flp pilus assembly protein TadG